MAPLFFALAIGSAVHDQRRVYVLRPDASVQATKSGKLLEITYPYQPKIAKNIFRLTRKDRLSIRL